MRRLAIAKGFCLALAFSASVGDALVRRSWLYEQMGEAPVKTASDERRNQVGLGLANSSRVFVSGVQGVLDLSVLELRLSASERFLPASASELEREKRTLGVEVARYYANAKQHWGRLGAELLHFLPGRVWTGKLAIDAGLLPSSQMPWSFDFGLRYFLQVPERGSVLQLGAAVLRNWDVAQTDSGVRWGGFLKWSLHTQEEETEGESQYLHFSIGPRLEWRSSLGVLRAELPVRVAVDRNRIAVAGKLQSQYPVSVSGPDFTVLWSVVF